MGGCVVAECLEKRYEDGQWGARCVTFRAPRGGVTVLLGPNGAGKTTTVGMLATLLRPTGGRGIVAGFDVVGEAWEVRRRVAVMPQEARVDPNWTPWEAVKWYLVARGLPRVEAERRAREALQALGLWGVRGRPGWVLSGGQRRKTVVAMVLYSGAEVVFLDEPTAGLDVESRYVVLEQVREKARGHGCVVVTTHDMREAEMLASHVVLMHRGRVVAEGAPGELRGRLPYSWRVVARGARSAPPAAASLRIGSTLILYAESRGEALGLASEVDADSVTVEPVGFEDVYLYHVHIGGGEGGRGDA